MEKNGLVDIGKNALRRKTTSKHFHDWEFDWDCAHSDEEDEGTSNTVTVKYYDKHGTKFYETNADKGRLSNCGKNWFSAYDHIDTKWEGSHGDFRHLGFVDVSINGDDALIIDQAWIKGRERFKDCRNSGGRCTNSLIA